MVAGHQFTILCRGMVVELPGGYRGIASPIKLSRTPASYRLAPLAEGDRSLLRASANDERIST